MKDSVGEAISLVNKIIANDVAVEDFLRLMHSYRKGLMNRNQIYSNFCVLFRDHPDVLEELQRVTFMEEEEQPVQEMAEQHQNLRKEQRVCAALAAADVRFTKTVTRKRTDRHHHDHDQGTDNDFQIADRHREGIKVFNKVREKLRNLDEYCRFLKLVHMYSTGKINGGDLETMVAELLQNDTDLVMEFAGFKRLCERDDSDHVSVAWGASNKAEELEEEKEPKRRRKTEKGRAEGGENKSVAWGASNKAEELEEENELKGRRKTEKGGDEGGEQKSVAWGASNKAEELQEERELKRRRETEKGSAEGGEEKLNVTIINGFNQTRCTPSYRLRLLDEFPASNNAASTSSKKEAPILNDYWVCEPSPDACFSSSKPGPKGPEDVYEDERYMLDMKLASLKSAIDNAQKLQSHILYLETPIRLENYFTASNLKLLSRELNGLRRKPAVALPAVLARLNQKKEEVSKVVSEMRVGYVSRRRRK